MTQFLNSNAVNSGWYDVTSIDEAWTWMQTSLVSMDAFIAPTATESTLVGASMLGSVRVRQVN
jgi:hypothetical protein